MSWPTVALGEIFEIARGGSPRPIDDYITDAPDGVNWISIKDASNSSKYITKTAKKILPSGVSRSREVKPGDFLLTNSMSFGRPYILRTSGCIHDGWLVLSGDNRIVDQDYFYHLLGSDPIYRKFKSLAAGAVVKNLNIDLVKTVSVPLPPIVEQRRIAAILDKADALRAQRVEAITKLDHLLQSIFLDMFGDAATNPKGWKVHKLGKVLAKLTDGTHHSPPPAESGVPYITAKHIKAGRIAFDSSPTYVAECDHRAIYARCNPMAGDVLYIKDGATTGVAAINRFDFEFSMLSSVALLRPLPGIVHPEYLESWLNSPLVKSSIIANVGGAAIKRLTLTKIGALAVPVPPMDIQMAFAATKKQVQSLKQAHLNSESTANDLFASLQKRVFQEACNP